MANAKRKKVCEEDVTGLKYFERLALLVEAMQLNCEKGSGLVKWRLHAQFDVEKYVPTRIDVTRNGGGELDERAVLGRTLEANRCYVKDRGYVKDVLDRLLVGETDYQPMRPDISPPVTPRIYPPIPGRRTPRQSRPPASPWKFRRLTGAVLVGAYSLVGNQKFDMKSKIAVFLFRHDVSRAIFPARRGRIVGHQDRARVDRVINDFPFDRQ